MSNHAIAGVVSCTLPPLKNNNVEIIQRYTITPFGNLSSDASCVARIIEIHLLNKLRPEGEKLFALTGHTIPACEATVEEINILLSRCAILCRREEEEYAFRQREVSDTEGMLKRLSSSSTSISAAKGSRQSRVDRDDVERRYQSALTRQIEQQTRLNHFKALPGLLAEGVRHIGEGINWKILNTFTRMPAIPTGFMNTCRVPEIINAVQFITGALDELAMAVNKIIQLCTFPIDKYDLDNGGVNRTLAYREYYQSDNLLLRAIVCDKDYVDYIYNQKTFSKRKNKLFTH
jgi:hypothetical protein